MGTIGNFEVSRKMLNAGLFACLHKHHNVEDLIEFYRTLMDENDTYLRCLLAVGLKDNGVEKVREIKRALGITVSVRLDGFHSFAWSFVKIGRVNASFTASSIKLLGVISLSTPTRFKISFCLVRVFSNVFGTIKIPLSVSIVILISKFSFVFSCILL